MEEWEGWMREGKISAGERTEGGKERMFKGFKDGR